MPFLLEQVISGGQTGVDQIALRIARELGYATGGVAPLGWMTDEGANHTLLAGYGLVESWFKGYRVRTMQNVRAADMTVWFGDATSPGGRLTIRYALEAMKYGKYFLDNPSSVNLRRALEEFEVRVLNVAGNRLRLNLAATTEAAIVLREALRRG